MTHSSVCPVCSHPCLFSVHFSFVLFLTCKIVMYSVHFSICPVFDALPCLSHFQCTSVFVIFSVHFCVCPFFFAHFHACPSFAFPFLKEAGHPFLLLWPFSIPLKLGQPHSNFKVMFIPFKSYVVFNVLLRFSCFFVVVVVLYLYICHLLSAINTLSSFWWTSVFTLFWFASLFDLIVSALLCLSYFQCPSLYVLLWSSYPDALT